nr:pyrroloquinoline quinone biosynthesis peptide chaperone PqqD [Mangrovicella endophytica]
MSGLDDGTVPRFPRGVKFREDKVRGQHMLLGPERIFNADPVATQILSLCDGKRTIVEIVDALTEVFAADAATIRPDVESFLIDLRQKQLVTL